MLSLDVLSPANPRYLSSTDASVRRGGPKPHPLADRRDEVAREMHEILQPLGFSNDGKTPIFATGTVAVREDIRG